MLLGPRQHPRFSKSFASTNLIILKVFFQISNLVILENYFWTTHLWRTICLLNFIHYNKDSSNNHYQLIIIFVFCFISLVHFPFKKCWQLLPIFASYSRDFAFIIFKVCYFCCLFQVFSQSLNNYSKKQFFQFSNMHTL